MKKSLAIVISVLLLLSCTAAAGAASNAENRLFKLFTPELLTGMLNEYVVSAADLLYPTVDENSRNEMIAYFQLEFSETNGSLLYYNNADWLVELSAYFKDGEGSRYDCADTITFSFPVEDFYFYTLETALIAALCSIDETLNYNQLAEYCDMCREDYLGTGAQGQKAYMPLPCDGFLYGALLYNQEGMTRCAFTITAGDGGSNTIGLTGREYTGSLSNYNEIHFYDASATSELLEGDIRFVADYAINPERNRPWVEGVGGDGIGQSITMEFARPETIKVLGFQIGYARSQYYYDINNRPKNVHISFSDGSGFDYTFRDTLKEQYIQLSVPIETTYVKVEIQGVYSGTLCKDTCIYLVRAFK